MTDQIKTIFNGITEGDQGAVITGVRAALDDGVDPSTILNQGMIAAMAEVGRLFEQGEYYVPEMLIAARAMKGGLGILRPALTAANVQAVGKIAIGTVQGDLHDIGKNLVSMMMEGAGFEVIDLGVDVSPAKFVDAVTIHRPDLIGCSALLTTTMPRMKDTLEALQSAGIRDQVKVMIGGAPVTAKYAEEIGADGFARDASSAASAARSLLNR